MSFPHFQNDVPYLPKATRLQTLDICLPRPLTESPPESTFWVIYIHGGAWRDPSITSSSFQPTLTRLLASPKPLSAVAGFASLNYRLSPYPSHTASPSSPDDQARNATHPQHLEDVLAGLRWLRDEYHVGTEYEYILVGHSCGATLAFQALRELAAHSEGTSLKGKEESLAPPSAIVGLCGIYDIPLLVSTHSHPAYREFVTAAFGAEEGDWADASPARGISVPREGRCIVVLGHSVEDELVDGGQRDVMAETLRREGFEESGAGEAGSVDRELVVLDMKGKHDEVWGKGEEVARAIDVALDRLAKRR